MKNWCMRELNQNIGQNLINTDLQFFVQRIAKMQKIRITRIDKQGSLNRDKIGDK